MKYLSIFLACLLILTGCGKNKNNNENKNDKNNNKIENQVDNEKNNKTEEVNTEEPASSSAGGFAEIKFDTNLTEEEVVDEASAVNAFLEDKNIEIINPATVESWSIKKENDTIISISKDKNEQTGKEREIEMEYELGEERILKSLKVDGNEVK